MSQQQCLDLARQLGVPAPKARELCRDPELQRCAAFHRPGKANDQSVDNLASCYGRRSTEGER